MMPSILNAGRKSLYFPDGERLEEKCIGVDQFRWFRFAV